jgi:hypothetical protein
VVQQPHVIRELRPKTWRITHPLGAAFGIHSPWLCLASPSGPWEHGPADIDDSTIYKGGAVRLIRCLTAVLAVLTAALVTTVGPSSPQIALGDTTPPDCVTSPYGQSVVWSGRNTVFEDGHTSGAASARRSFRMSGSRLDTSGITVPTDSSVLADNAMTAADLDGDGRDEIIRAASYADTTRWTTVTPFGHTSTSPPKEIAGSPVILPPYEQVEMAAGRFLPATQDTLQPARQVAVLGRSSDTEIHLDIFGGSASGLDEVPIGSATYRKNPGDAFSLNRQYQLLDVAFGDIDGNGTQDVVTAFAMNTRYLHVEAYTYDADGSFDTTGHIRPILREWLPSPSGYNSIRHLRLSVGDVDGDFVDDIAIAWDDTNGLTIPDEIHVHTYKYRAATQTLSDLGHRDIVDQYLFDDRVPAWDLTTADVDLDHRDDIIVAQARAADSVSVKLLQGNTPDLAVSRTWSAVVPKGPVYTSPRYMTVGAGDQNNDGRADIALSYNDREGWLQTYVVSEPKSSNSLVTLSGRTEIVNNHPDDVVVADWDNSSVRTVYAAPAGGVRCADVQLPVLVSGIDAPPTWEHLQDAAEVWTGLASDKITVATSEQSHTETFTDSSEWQVGVRSEFYPSLFGLIEIGGEYENHVDEKYETENGMSTTTGDETASYTSTGWTHSEDGRAVQFVTVPYRCYFYQVVDKTAQNAWQVLCSLRVAHALDGATVASQSSWDNDFGPVLNPGNSKAWVPVQPEWNNLVLQASQITASSGPWPTKAGDGNPIITDHGSAWRSDTEVNPYWQVDLGSSSSLDSVSIYPEALSCDDACVDDEAFPRDLKVFVFDDPALKDIKDPDVLAQQPGVQSYYWDGPTLTRLNVQTRGSNGDPAIGRFVRVQRLGTGSLRLAEVQVYPSDPHVDPVRYPADVLRVSGHDDYFQAKVWIDRTRSWKWIDVQGRLLYDATGKLVNGDDTFKIGRGQGVGNSQSWQLLQSVQTSKGESSTTGTATENSAGEAIGGGLNIARLVYEQATATGIETSDEVSHISTVGSQFTLFGYDPGLYHDDAYDRDGITYEAPVQCEFAFKPFYYQAQATSSMGVAQSYLAVASIVPETGLDRTADLTNCRDGIRRRNGHNQAPEVSPLSVSTTAGHSVTVDVVSRATDPNSGDIQGDENLDDSVDLPEHLRVADVATTMVSTTGPTATTAAGGTVKVSGDDNVVYTPPAGFSGMDTFYVRVTDGDLLSARGDAATGDLGKVTVRVGQPVDLMQNGSLEGATSAPWTVSQPYVWNQYSLVAHSGKKDLLLSGDGKTASASFSLPPGGSPTLAFWQKITKSSQDAGGRLDLQAVVGGATTTLRSWGNADDTAGAWVQRSIDLSQFAGQTVTLRFVATEPPLYGTIFSLDDFSLMTW